MIGPLRPLIRAVVGWFDDRAEAPVMRDIVNAGSHEYFAAEDRNRGVTDLDDVLGSTSAVSSTRNHFWPALVAFLVLPGVVAFLVPWLLRPAGRSSHIEGVPVLVVGVGLLLWCVRDFYVAGRGTLAPWAPPERLVVVGLYRVSRNPMYIAVLIVLCGWAAMFASRTLWVYAAVVAVAFYLRVIFGEEPWLARTHGLDWDAYRAHVPRWIGIRSSESGM